MADGSAWPSFFSKPDDPPSPSSVAEALEDGGYGGTGDTGTRSGENDHFLDAQDFSVLSCFFCYTWWYFGSPKLIEGE
jgi:hypothetical protein